MVEARLENNLFSLWQANTFLTPPILHRAAGRGYGSGQAHTEDRDRQEGLNPQGQSSAGDKCLLLLCSRAK